MTVGSEARHCDEGTSQEWVGNSSSATLSRLDGAAGTLMTDEQMDGWGWVGGDGQMDG